MLTKDRRRILPTCAFPKVPRLRRRRFRRSVDERLAIRTIVIRGSIMRCVSTVVAFVCVCFFGLLDAKASVSVQIDLTSQSMHVTSANGEAFDWPISSARSGYYTPRGAYRPQRLERMHYSHKYHMSPMPYSIFFAGGYAIHGTYSVAELGHPASHGCVRLAPENAATLYSLVQTEGASISITGSPPGVQVYAAARHHGTHLRLAGRHHRHSQTLLAYAQPRKAPSLRQWLHNPAAR